MDELIKSLIAECRWDTTNFLFISDNVFDPFIYYSHIVPLVASLLIGYFIFFKNPYLLVNKILFVITNLFALWVFGDLILWATDKSHYTIFVWSLINLIEPFIYVFSVYFVQVFITNKDTLLKNKILLFAPIAPVILFAFTKLNLLGFNLIDCDREAIEGPLSQYIYIIEVFYVLYIAIFAIRHSRKQIVKKKNQIFLVTISILLFLLTFSWGNIVGSITDDWRVSQWGLFGMPIFIAILSFLIIKYNAFNIKVISTQILVTSFSILIASQFLLHQSVGNRIIILITFVLSIFSGFSIAQSVKREIQQKEHMEKLAIELEIANRRQEELLHFITHQIKGFLTKSRNIFAEILEGTFGEINGEVKEIAEQGFRINTDGVSTVQTILNAANIRTGKLSYNMAPVDLSEIIRKVFEKSRKVAEAKGLQYSLEISQPADYKFNGDEIQLSEAFSNLIDNSIKYTPGGEIRLKLDRNQEKLRFSVKDTGIGIAPEDQSKLFTEGGRGKNALEVNVDSTGFGLFIVKNVIKAHNGKVWVESEGQGKGSEFVVEL